MCHAGGALAYPPAGGGPKCAAFIRAASARHRTAEGIEPEELGNIRVTTFSKAPTELWVTPTALDVITNEDIVRSGVTTIADALRLAPGVEVGRLSSTTWAVGIRGLQNNFSKSVLVLIDGRNVYTPLFAGVYWDVQDMPLENIERIEVIRGRAAQSGGRTRPTASSISLPNRRPIRRELRLML